ncbi:MAG: DNA mismatch repair protein MutS [Thermaerobacter sp.]|nr:DNA mismatch repair protein MutS [Thermaerobacter sp.]
MEFTSILFLNGEDRPPTETLKEPDFLADLNLDQVFDAVAQGREQYNLKPFFYSPLTDVDSILYRHEVFQDIESPNILSCIQSFAQAMRVMRTNLAQVKGLYYQRQKQRWLLDAVSVYCDAVASLAQGLGGGRVSSRGLAAFSGYVRHYCASEQFRELRDEASMLMESLSKVAYCVLIKDSTVMVRKYEGENDYSVEVERTFTRFKEAAAKDYRIQFQEWIEMDHVEANILEFVAKLYPDVFQGLEDFYSRWTDYVDETIATFDREVQFYLAFLDFIAPLRRRGLAFCYPKITMSDNPIYGRDTFDVALANHLEGRAVVCNTWQMTDRERIFVVSGPNQGGKTTFARSFGQMHYLGTIGCLVPGEAARLLLFDHLFTHFERQENVASLTGKLEDDLLRMRAILERASGTSIILINEMLASTTLRDGILLGRRIMEKLRQLGSVCIWVTFIEELATDSEVVASLLSTVEKDAPTVRTYKIERHPPVGIAHALSLAERYGLTYEALKERIRS